MVENTVWPDPVPCRPTNPVQAIRQCEARRTTATCPYLKVQYCGIQADEMLDALELLGLSEFSWLLDDDAEADDVADAVGPLGVALSHIVTKSRREEDALTSVRWLLKLLKHMVPYGCGLSGRFGERLAGKDRY